MLRALGRIGGHPGVAYPAIAALQLKIVWGMWLYRDLTFGDTASYYRQALKWVRTLRGSLSWSPLYTAFYGAFAGIFGDPYAATTLHRLGIVLVLALLVLALARQFLPPGLAWLAAAWWCALPIGFDSLYEVHLFAAVPVLAAVAAIRWRPGPVGRGIALALLGAATVLVRNELSLVVLLLGGSCFAWEVRRWRRGEPGRRLLASYGAPAAAAALIVLAFASRDSDPSLRDSLDGKHRLNVCQVYAFGYQQRHPEWTANPWIACEALMTRDFGAAQPTFLEAFRRNPAAMGEHLWWNARMIPAGLQALLFNVAAPGPNPDYVPIPESPLAWPLTAAAAGTLLLGGLLALRERRSEPVPIWSDAAWSWVAMVSVGAVGVVVMLTQRPRPSYQLALGVFLRILLVLSAARVVRGLGAERVDRAAMAGAVAAMLLVPPHWNREAASRPLLRALRRLEPFRALLVRPGSALASAGYPFELCSYLALPKSCRAVPLLDLPGGAETGAALSLALDDRGVTVVYADEGALSLPAVAQLTAEPSARGWRPVVELRAGEERWSLLERTGREGGSGRDGGFGRID
jgi:hypothetical protein